MLFRKNPEQAAEPVQHAVCGIEYDGNGVRAVRCVRNGPDALPRVTGFCEAALGHGTNIVHALRRASAGAGMLSIDTLACCMGGRNVYAGEVVLPPGLPAEDADTAVRAAMRMYMVFDLATARVMWRPGDVRSGALTALAVAVREDALHDHLRIFVQAGLMPRSVEALPLACADASRLFGAPGCRDVIMGVYAGEPAAVTICGEGSPSFFRILAGEQRRVDTMAGFLTHEAAIAIDYYERINHGLRVDTLALMGPGGAELAPHFLSAFPGRRVSTALEQPAPFDNMTGSRFAVAHVLARRVVVAAQPVFEVQIIQKLRQRFHRLPRVSQALDALASLYQAQYA